MSFKVDLKIIFFLIIFYFTDQLNLYILIMTFAFIHECAHIFLGMILGFKLKKIELMPFGFLCNLKPNIKDYNIKILKSNLVELKKIFVISVGPIMNLILMLLVKNDVMIYSNLMLFIINILPIFPLDGGRFIKSLSKLCFGRKKSSYIINKISNIFIILLTFVCSILILYIKNIEIVFILIYLWYLVILENKRYMIKKKIYFC